MFSLDLGREPRDAQSHGLQCFLGMHSMLAGPVRRWKIDLPLVSFFLTLWVQVEVFVSIHGKKALLRAVNDQIFTKIHKVDTPSWSCPAPLSQIFTPSTVQNFRSLLLCFAKHLEGICLCTSACSSCPGCLFKILRNNQLSQSCCTI